MRALFVCASPVAGSEALVAELAPGFDRVIAVDGGGAVCSAAGVAPDLLVGDLDSLDAAEAARLSETGCEVVRFPAEKDATDLELALGVASERGVTEATLTCATSGRLDHTLGVLASCAAHPTLSPEILEPEVRAWLIDAATRDTLSLVGLGSTVSLIAFGGPVVVTFEGVRWPLARATLTVASTLGVSNVIVDETGARVSLSKGMLVVISSAVGGVQPARRA